MTPFKASRLNIGEWEAGIERAAAARITGVVVLGTTGESPAITEPERVELISNAIKRSAGRVKVMVGTGSNNLDHARHQVEQAAELGADAVLIVTPYYNKPTQTGLRNYFLTLADSSRLPIIIYHIPGRCGVGVSPSLTLELAHHERIVGIKDAGGDVIRVSELARLAPPGFTVLSGDDALTLPMMSVGARGVVSVLSNLAPRLTREMVDLALAGDFASALKIHRRLSPLMAALFLETSPSPAKEAMHLLGHNVGSVRPPLAPVEASTKQALKRALELAGELR